MRVQPVIKIKLPNLPNYLLVDDDRLDQKHTIHISRVPEDQLRAIGEAWVDALIQKAAASRRDTDASA